jgi:hypothetical protein
VKGTMCDTMDPQSTLKSPCRKTHLQTRKCCVPPGWLRTYQCGIPSPLPPTDKPKWPRNRESTLTEFLQSEKIIRGSSHPLGYRNLERVCGGTSDYGKRVVFGIYFYIYVTTIISVFVPGQSRVIQKLNYYFSFCPRSVTVDTEAEKESLHRTWPPWYKNWNNNCHNKCKSKFWRRPRLLEWDVTSRTDQTRDVAPLHVPIEGLSKKWLKSGKGAPRPFPPPFCSFKKLQKGKKMCQTRLACTEV